MLVNMTMTPIVRRRRRVLYCILATAATAVSVALTGAPAEAAIDGSKPPSSASQSDRNMPGAVTRTITTRQGTLTYGWRPFTAEENAARAAGATAKELLANGSKSASSAGGAAVVSPNSASGCSENVCITVIGSGLYISDWNTRAIYSGNYICTRSRWWFQYRNDPPPGWLERTGNGVCGGAGVFFSDWQAQKGFPTGVACNTWDYIVGRPCESIYR